MNARRLLAWTDLEASRRIGTTRVWARRTAIAVGLAALVAWKQASSGPLAALATWHAIVVAVFATTMLATALGMFWRADAGMLARLPIDGRALLAAAVVRAARAAVVAAGTVVVAAVPVAAVVTAAPPGLAATVLGAVTRGLALVGALTVAAAALIPAAAAAAALLVAGGQAGAAARSMMAIATSSPRAAAAGVAAAVVDARPQQVPTTALGALPGTAAAWMVILAITVRWWVLDGGDTAIGPALPWLAAAAGVSLLALAGVWRKGGGMAVALREVAALDRQRLAHLEIHPPRGLEVVVMRLVGRRAGLYYSKDARLMRRRYPMAWALGLIAWCVGIGIAIAKPADPVVWGIGLAVATGAYAFALAGRLGRPPIELPRLAAQLPIPTGAPIRARVAWILSWLAVFALPPSLIATLTTHAGPVPLAVLAAGALAAVAAAARRG